MDSRARRTHALLYAAFWDLIKEQSFDEISVSQLCDTAGVRRATFYRHFSDKDTFCAAFIHHMRLAVSELITNTLGANHSLNSYCKKMTEVFADLIVHNEAVVARQQRAGSLDRLLGIITLEMTYAFADQIRSNSYGSTDRAARSLVDGHEEGFAAFYIGGLFGLLRKHISDTSMDGSFDRQAFLKEHRQMVDRLLPEG